MILQTDLTVLMCMILVVGRCMYILKVFTHFAWTISEVCILWTGQ